MKKEVTQLEQSVDLKTEEENELVEQVESVNVNEEKPSKRSRDYLSLENTKSLRGILALLVIIGHVRGAMTFINDTIIGQVLTMVSAPALSLFFFFTGFGLRESFARKENYSKTFLTKRIVPYYVKYIIFLTIYLIFNLILYGFLWEIDWKTFGLSFIWGGTYVENGWYLQTTLLIYLVFWLAYLPKWNIKYTYVALGVALIGYIAMCLLLGGFFPYYANYILCVPFGYIWSINKERIDKYLNGKVLYWIILLASIACAVALIIVARIVFASSALPQMITTMISGLFMCVAVIALIKKVPIKCKITSFLGEISLEIYALHGIFLTVFLRVFANGIQTWLQSGLYFLLVLACTIPIAWGLHWLLKLLDKKVFRKIKN